MQFILNNESEDDHFVLTEINSTHNRLLLTDQHCFCYYVESEIRRAMEYSKVVFEEKKIS